MRKVFQCWIFVGLFAPCFAQRQIPSQTAAPGSFQDFSVSRFAPARRVIGVVSGSITLPAASTSTNQEYLVTNGSTSSDCTVGGGSTRVNCVSNGSAWVAVGGSGGGGGTIPSTTSTLKGDGAGNAAAVTGTGTDCVFVNGSSGSCGGGATAAYLLTDMQLTLTSGGTVWTINAAAGATTPVNWGGGNTGYHFTSAGTVTPSSTSNTGTAYWCLNPADGTIHFRHNSSTTMTGSGVTVDTGATSCTSGGVYYCTLWVVTFTANVPDALTEAMDRRTPAGCPSEITGTGGITASVSAGKWVVDGSGISGSSCFIDFGPPGAGNSVAAVLPTSWTSPNATSNISSDHSGASKVSSLTYGTNSTTSEYSYRKLPLPNGCRKAALNFKVEYWTNAAGNVELDAAWVCVSTGANGNNPTFPTDATSIVAVSGTTTTTFSSIFTVDLSACTAHQNVWFRLARNGATSGDSNDLIWIDTVSLYE